jgi:hypothetical protein
VKKNVLKKNLGHYTGEVDIVKKFNDPIHQSLYILYQTKNSIQKNLDATNQKIKELEKQIKPDIESGKIDWAWIWMMKRTNVKWKDEFIKHCGTKKAEEVQSEYKTMEYPQIGIRGIHPNPETIEQIKPNKPTIPIKRLKLKK